MSNTPKPATSAPPTSSQGVVHCSNAHVHHGASISQDFVLISANLSEPSSCGLIVEQNFKYSGLPNTQRPPQAWQPGCHHQQWRPQRLLQVSPSYDASTLPWQWEEERCSCIIMDACTTVA